MVYSPPSRLSYSSPPLSLLPPSLPPSLPFSFLDSCDTGVQIAMYSCKIRRSLVVLLLLLGLTHGARVNGACKQCTINAKGMHNSPLSSHSPALHIFPPSTLTFHPAPFPLPPSPFPLPPSPFTLHPSPFTLHPSLFSLLPSPFSLLRSPFSILHSSFSILPPFLFPLLFSLMPSPPIPPLPINYIYSQMQFGALHKGDVLNKNQTVYPWTYQ